MDLTLVPDALAHPGYRFTFLGANDGEECQDCPVRGMCFKLEPGRVYEVVERRAIAHPCNLHDEGKARVVRVKPAPFAASLDVKHLRGTAATWDAPDCGMPECANWNLCHPRGPTQGIRYAIDSVGESLDCPVRLDLKRVQLSVA